VVWARVCDPAPVPRSRRHSGRRAPPIPPATIRHHAGAGGADHRTPSPAHRPSRGEIRLMARTAPPSLRPVRGGHHVLHEGIPSPTALSGSAGPCPQTPGFMCGPDRRGGRCRCSAPLWSPAASYARRGATRRATRPGRPRLHPCTGRRRHLLVLAGREQLRSHLSRGPGSARARR
jgi:hypothetical protein